MLNETQSGEARYTAGMANVLFDIPFAEGFAAYLGGGLGGAVLDLATSEIEAGDVLFAFQGMAGVTVEIADGVALFGGYRFFGTLDSEIESSRVQEDSALDGDLLTRNLTETMHQQTINGARNHMGEIGIRFYLN